MEKLVTWLWPVLPHKQVLMTCSMSPHFELWPLALSTDVRLESGDWLRQLYFLNQLRVSLAVCVWDHCLHFIFIILLEGSRSPYIFHSSSSYMKRAQSVMVLPPHVFHRLSDQTVCSQLFTGSSECLSPNFKHADSNMLFSLALELGGEGGYRPWPSWILESCSDHSSHSCVWHLVVSACSPSLSFGAGN